MSAVRRIHGLVLAGGFSRRMGLDKASLPHPDGRTMLNRTLDQLRLAGCHGLAVSLRHDQLCPDLAAEVAVVRDPKGESHGPLSGIIHCLAADRDVDWLVVACDLPNLDAGTLRHLIESRLEGEMWLAYRSESDGLPEPLCAVYAAESLFILEQERDAGLRCPRKILIRRECRLLMPPVRGALANANTPDDWKSATA